LIVVSKVDLAQRPPPTTLYVGPCEDEQTRTLVRFGFGSFGPGAYRTGLTCLGGDLAEECWQVSNSVTVGTDDGVRWHQAGDLLFMAWEQPDDPRLDSALAAEDGYQNLLSLAARHGCEKLLRAWNFMPSINLGDGDAERYRRFCVGRARALEAVGLEGADLCAGTAIGGEDPTMRIFVLAGPTPGINIENPRQLSAFRYPRIYGPRSPSFARATAIPQPDGSTLLMISGTASVVGHETTHDGNLDGQVDEIVTNMTALLEESVRRLGRTKLATFGPHSLLRVYVRHAEHWPAVHKRLSRVWPESPMVGLRGDICRSDLLLEVEAVTVG
jgi:chorismate lyase/3-hydroxybenzoate synthase